MNPLKFTEEEGKDKLYDLQVNLQWKILCPQCQSDQCWKDGFDRRNYMQQRYRCVKCSKRFYGHTSYFPLCLRQLLVQYILSLVITSGMALKTVAELLQMSSSTISRVVCFSQQTLQSEKKQQLLRKFKQLSPAQQEVVYLDETFYSIAGKTVYLILLCDAVGRILAWELSPTRQSKDILRILQLAEQRYPHWCVLVADGAFTYRQAFLMLGSAGLLIHQVHSRPWHDVWLRLFEPHETGCREAQVLLPYTALQSTELVPIAAQVQEHDQNFKVKSKKPLRRFHLAPESLHILPNKFAPVNPFCELAVSKLRGIFGKKGSIQSNRIESVNSQIKRLSSTSGLKTLPQLKRRLKLLIDYLAGSPEPGIRQFRLSSKSALKNAVSVLSPRFQFSMK